MPIERTEVSSRDRVEADALFEQMYVGHYPRTGPNRADTELTARSTTAGDLAAERVRMSMSLDTDAFGTLLSFQLLSGTMRIDDGTDEVRLSRGGTVMYRPDVPLRAQADGFELAMLRVPVQRAAAIVEQQTGIDAADLRFESMRPVSEAMDRYFSSVINMVHRDLMQHAFRQHHETTPMGYLQQVRLARAHSELTAADPSNGETVATIAARWGFAKPGRFATAYRQTYGQLPSHTLRT